MDSHKNEVIKQLTDMGFEANSCERAYVASDIKTVEGIINWLDQHGNDPGINDPIPAGGLAPSQPQAAGASKGISHMVNQEHAKKLMEMGYSKNVAEKSLLMTGNKDKEEALQWIYDHMGDADFEEELQLVEGEAPKDKPPAVQLTEEEKLQKAKELQAMLRAKREAREKEEEQERERARVAGGKALAKAKREMDEAEHRRAVEIKVMEKKDDELAKQKILDQIEKDRRERFGDQASVAAVKKDPPMKTIKDICGKIRVIYPAHTYKELLRSLFTAIKAFIENIVKNPGEEKYQKINLSNAKFKERVGDIIGGINILKEAGFEEKDGFLVMQKGYDTKLLEDVMAAMDYEMYYLN